MTQKPNGFGLVAGYFLVAICGFVFGKIFVILDLIGINMNGKPTKKQQDFQDWCRNEYGCVVDGMNADCIHHIKGARMRLKGVSGLAGEWYILPMSYWWHQDGNNPRAVHVNRKAFESRVRKTQKELWIELIKDYESEFDKKPMSEIEYQIIVDRG